MIMDLGGGAGAFEAGDVQGVRSVTFPSTPAAAAALCRGRHLAPHVNLIELPLS